MAADKIFVFSCCDYYSCCCDYCCCSCYRCSCGAVVAGPLAVAIDLTVSQCCCCCKHTCEWCGCFSDCCFCGCWYDSFCGCCSSCGSGCGSQLWLLLRKSDTAAKVTEIRNWYSEPVSNKTIYHGFWLAGCKGVGRTSWRCIMSRVMGYCYFHNYI